MATNEIAELNEFGTTAAADESTHNELLDVTRTPAWPAPDAEECGCREGDGLACYAHYERERDLRGEQQ